jgi:hypothetical protein
MLMTSSSMSIRLSYSQPKPLGPYKTQTRHVYTGAYHDWMSKEG